MKKFLFLCLSIILFAACSSDENDAIIDNGKLEPAQMVDVWIGMKEVGNGDICANIMRVPFCPIPDEEWPAPLLEQKRELVPNASVCRITTDKGVFYHKLCGYDNNLGGYFYTGEGLHLYYYGEDHQHHLRQELPEGFPELDGWECIYYNYRWNF